MKSNTILTTKTTYKFEVKANGLDLGFNLKQTASVIKVTSIETSFDRSAVEAGVRANDVFEAIGSTSLRGKSLDELEKIWTWHDNNHKTFDLHFSREVPKEEDPERLGFVGDAWSPVAMVAAAAKVADVGVVQRERFTQMDLPPMVKARSSGPYRGQQAKRGARGGRGGRARGRGGGGRARARGRGGGGRARGSAGSRSWMPQAKRDKFGLAKNFYKESKAVQERSDKDVAAWRKKHGFEAPKNCPKPLSSFEDANLPPSVLGKLKGLGFEAPLPIQAQGWPIIMSGNDMIGIAQTGSGKTAGFMIPGIVHMMANPRRPRHAPVVLCMAPTRELAMGIAEDTRSFCDANVVEVYGGAPGYEQRKQLRRGCDICVATPGRLYDFLERRQINLDNVSYLILDEADRMLDMGFEPQIRSVVEYLRPSDEGRQTVLFSATWPADKVRPVQRIAAQFLKDPIMIKIGEDLSINPRIKHVVKVVDYRDKAEALKEVLCSDLCSGDHKTIVFVERKKACWELTKMLRSLGAEVEDFHSDRPQNERTDAMERFKYGDLPLLISTDAGSRGLDVKKLRLVIQYDYSHKLCDFVHRAGRTARAGNTGTCVTFIEPSAKDGKKTPALMKYLTDVAAAAAREPKETRGGVEFSHEFEKIVARFKGGRGGTSRHKPSRQKKPAAGRFGGWGGRQTQYY